MISPPFTERNSMSYPDRRSNIRRSDADCDAHRARCPTCCAFADDFDAQIGGDLTLPARVPNTALDRARLMTPTAAVVSSTDPVRVSKCR